MLRVKSINSFYESVQILKNISFKINTGEIVALVGGNGAGKTATLKTISGLIHPRSGSIHFCDENITDVHSYRIVEKGLILVPEGRKLFPSLTVFENLDLGAYTPKARDAKTSNLESVFQMFPVLRERISQLAGSLSGGEQQMLSIARGLMSSPKLLMLDEPSVGIAPILVKEIFGKIEGLNKTGTTIFLVEQNVRQSLALADRAYVLENGRLTLEGTGKELLENDHVITTYLGL
ncbi:MAG: ABC transporter ATP-binding protein [Thermodesulfobacteriota bacterium]